MSTDNHEAPILSVEGLTKRYGKKEAVSNLSFTAARGELIGLLGPNGAGKSTTLRMIAGSLAPSAGSARITGYDIAEQSMAAKAATGYLPETPPLYPEMTVKEYLRFARELKTAARVKPPANISGGGAAPNADDDSRWTENLVERLELGGVMSVLIRNLSKGYKQRTGIAAAAMGRPSLLLLDEPASGLDPRQAAELRALLKYLSARMTIIVSSHGLYDVASLCGRIIIMSEGKIAADGSPEELARMKTGDRDKDLDSGDTRLARELEEVFIELTKPEAG